MELFKKRNPAHCVAHLCWFVGRWGQGWNTFCCLLHFLFSMVADSYCCSFWRKEKKGSPMMLTMVFFITSTKAIGRCQKCLFTTAVESEWKMEREKWSEKQAQFSSNDATATEIAQSDWVFALCRKGVLNRMTKAVQTVKKAVGEMVVLARTIKRDPFFHFSLSFHVGVASFDQVFFGNFVNCLEMKHFFCRGRPING